MKCPSCRQETSDTGKFCSQCGCRLSVTAGARFWTSDRPEPYTPNHLKNNILNRKSVLDGEKKRVTVLFADVANFTSMAEELDPEEVHQIMDGCFGILMNETHRYEGTINQFRGDGVMALFGAPLAYEDHAQRACHAALGIQGALQKYSQELKARLGLNFKMRIGISTGAVVVGSIGDDLRMDYTADGDTTNLASRMESLAEPGRILVSRDTYKIVRSQFECRPMGPMAVKGKKSLVEAYELRVKRPSVRTETDRRIYSSLVGRESALNRMVLHLLKAVNGEGSIVNVTGEAGMGKSRLIAELKKNAETKKVLLFEGRALAIGKNLSFHPITDLLKSWTGIAKEDTERQSAQKLEKAIRRLCAEEADELFPFIGRLMGLELVGKHLERLRDIEGEALEKLILKSVRELLIQAARIRPIAIIIEDLHWSDLTTIGVLESLFRLAEDHRILFINVFRTGYRETGDRLLRNVQDLHPEISLNIHLDPLSPTQCETLIANLTKTEDLPGNIKSRIIRRAEGNPFFIEEVVRSLIDQGVMEPEAGMLKALDGIMSVAIPENIQDVILARIDKLEEETKTLLKVASVIGRSFFYKILSHVADDIDGINEKLAHLKEVQLIREREEMGEVEYVFKHGLTQEATYESILHNQKKELHLKVARAIESVFPDNLHAFYGILAYHYSKGENMDQAETYLLRAGEEALKSSASTEALNLYQEALRLYLVKSGKEADSEKIAGFEKNIALAFFNKGQHENARRHFDNALGLWGVGTPRNRFSMFFRMIFDLSVLITGLYISHKRTGKRPTDRDNEILDLSYKRAMALVHLDPRRCFVEFLSTLKRLQTLEVAETGNGVGIWMSASGLFSWSGISFRLSRKILEYTRQTMNEGDLKHRLYFELFELIHCSLKGEWDQIRDYDQGLVDASLKVGEHWHAFNYLLFHGFIKIEQGDFDKAEMIIDALTDIWKAYGNENARATRRFLRLRLLVAQRGLRKALAEADESLHESETGRPSILYYLGYKAIIQILLKDLEGAGVTLKQSEAFYMKQGRVPPIFLSAYFMGQFLFDLQFLENAVLSNDRAAAAKHRKRARKSGHKAFKISDRYAFTRAVTLRLLGQYHWLIGGQKTAGRYWMMSVAEAKGLDARIELARTYGEIGRRLASSESRFRELDGVGSDEYLAKAERLFEAMGLQRSLSDFQGQISWSHSVG